MAIIKNKKNTRSYYQKYIFIEINFLYIYIKLGKRDINLSQ